MTASPARTLFAGGGVAGEVMHSLDWSRTPLGPVDTWPASLRTTVGILLRSRQPMFLWWGPELIQFYNDAYIPCFGVGKHPNAMGARARDTWPEIWSIIGPRIEQVMRHGKPIWNEDARVPIVRNGALEDVYWTYGYSPVFDESGAVGGTLVICTETTARVLAAEHDRAERDRIHHLFAQAPAAICILRGPGLVFEFANQQYCRLLGIDAPVGKPLLQALPALAESEIVARTREVMRTGEPWMGHEMKFELDRPVRGREDCFFTLTVSPLRDSSGAVDGASIFAFDVTDHVIARHRAEDLAVQLERAIVGEQAAREAAEVANRAKDDFLATLSHELRTPLTAMLGWVRMLIDAKIAPAKRDHALRVIERNAVAQARLIEDLLDVSRIIAGNLHLQCTTVDLARAAELALDSVKPMMDAKKIEVRPPATTGASPVLGDPHRLQQVIWNLLVNAVKFTEPGGVVRVTLKHTGARVELRVEDSGRGISPEFLPHVFDRFKQAEAGSRRSQGGLGLGLAISRHLVELHRGSLTASSDGLGTGASFVLSLPLVRQASAQASTAPDEAAPDLDDLAEINGLRVLVVDDEDVARERVAGILATHGAIPIEAQNAADALEALVRLRPDVLLSDIGMPGEDGYSLIRRIRLLAPGSGAGTPAAALTAYTSAEDRSQALVAGYQMHLAKPIGPTALVTTVASLARIAHSIR